MKIAADKELWADELKKSHDFYNPDFDYYYDYRFTCRGCNKDKIWTAEEQKVHYEVLKKVNAVSSLCNDCFIEYNKLKTKCRKFRAKWNEETEKSKKSASYIAEWLKTIQEYKKYTDKYDSGMEHRLARLLKKNKSSQALKKDTDNYSAT